MRKTGLLALLLLVIVSFGVAGGCNNNSGNGGDGGVGEPAPGPNEPQYDLELAIDLMELSLVAYNQRTQCINGGMGAITVPSHYTLKEVIYRSVITGSPCLDDDTVIPFAFIATLDDNIYVVFRGTETFSDEISDIAAFQIPYNFVPNGGKVSLGFLSAYQGDNTNPVQSAILSKLDELTMTGNYSNLYITGHSLGGAVAFLAFPDFSQNVGMIDSVTMYNFAGPAVGDSQFVSTYEATESLNRASFRIVNTNDLVPMLPPLGLNCDNFSYFHVDGEEKIFFGTVLPALPDFAGDSCDLVTIAAQLVVYGLINKDAIGENHSHCTYFSTLCSMGSSPSTCSQRAIGCTP
ncbi:MAG: lipase family protein [Thermodesulfobacteriales bacterium]|nr:MAG: lipase family protein [Thermodesulfobacteriales bacterium]